MKKVFAHKGIPDDNKVNLVALKLYTYASIWWNNALSKRTRKGKADIRSWRKIKAKLKAKFLSPHYLQDSYSKLHNLRQETKNMENYNREFNRLIMTYDLRENQDQPVARYLGA